jgi:hypothetical protein
MTRPCIGASIYLVAVSLSVSCVRPTLGHSSPVRQPAPQVSLVELWSEPRDLTQRDLFVGSGQQADAPRADDLYTVISEDKTGYSKGYNVMAPDGRAWDIKLGREVQPEIVLSRILWALGYYQPATYYVTGWQLSGTWESEGLPARFRLQSDHQNDGEWAWLDNPFVGTRPMQGLIAINVLLNNQDFKTSNNRVYRVADSRAEPSRRYVVQDLGFALGKSRGFPHIIGTRNDVDDYESVGLIKKIDGTKVQIDYRGLHTNVVERLTPVDVVWASELMDRLSDAQLDDAFRAADYPPEIRKRYVAKLRGKIREGLTLRTVQEASSGAPRP